MSLDYSEIEKRLTEAEQRIASLEYRARAFDEACTIIQELARLIAGWEHLPAVPAELRERAEKFGANFSG